MNVQSHDFFGAVPCSGELPEAWRDFVPGAWTRAIDVRDFLQKNVTRPHRLIRPNE